jgi:hypothetical protein
MGRLNERGYDTQTRSTDGETREVLVSYSTTVEAIQYQLGSQNGREWWWQTSELPELYQGAGSVKPPKRTDTGRVFEPGNYRKRVTTVLTRYVGSNDHADPWWTAAYGSITHIHVNPTQINLSKSNDPNTSKKQAHNHLNYLQLWDSTAVAQEQQLCKSKKFPIFNENSVHYSTHNSLVTGFYRKPDKNKSTIFNYI